MADSVDLDDFTKCLVDACRTYTDDVKKNLKSGIRKIARETKAEVTANSPVGKTNLKRGFKHYKDGWTTSATESNGVYKITIHNKKYQLVHLLELGHLNRDGTSRTPKIPHVEPAEKHADEKVDELLEKL